MLFQVIGTLISIMGAALVVFFKGPLIRPSSHQLRHAKHFFVFSSIPEFWVLGGFLLASASFSVSLWNFIQVQIKYISLFNISLTLGMLAERDLINPRLL